MFSADVRASFQVAFSLSVNFLEIRKLIYVLEMVIAPPPPSFLRTPNSSLPVASICFSGCEIQVYSDQWLFLTVPAYQHSSWIIYPGVDSQNALKNGKLNPLKISRNNLSLKFKQLRKIKIISCITCYQTRMFLDLAAGKFVWACAR